MCQEVRDLIRKMSLANPLWGAPRVHGELLKLGIDLAQATVAKYMARHQKTPSQSWRTFLDSSRQGPSLHRFLRCPDSQFSSFVCLSRSGP